MRTHIIRWGTLAALLGGLLLTPSQPAQAAPERCFPETGQCLSGRFLEYWEQNGGLPVFGFPISAPRQELNADTDQPYLTQWFERNSFELHPENAAPYDVLLGRLGDGTLRRNNRDWQQMPRESGPQPGCVWFEQTGRNVCDEANGLGFKSFWQKNGLLDPALDSYRRSLALFGLPITTAQMEMSSDGQMYLTQWFERAKFEWHPRERNQYKVLLGLLGNEVRAVPAGSVLLSSNYGNFLTGAGNYLFWYDLVDPRNQEPTYSIDTRLMMHNLADGTTSVIVQGQGDNRAFASDGRGLVWLEPANDRYNIRYTDLATRQTRTVVSGVEKVSDVNLAIDGNALFYRDEAEGHTGLFLRDLANGNETLIAERGGRLVARDGKLLWFDAQRTGSGPGRNTTFTLYLRLSNGEIRTVATDIPSTSPSRYTGYDVLGDNVVWSMEDIGDTGRVKRYQISTGAVTTLSADVASTPKLDGGTVVWATDPFLGQRTEPPTWKLQRYDLGNGSTTDLTAPLRANVSRPMAIVGGKVAMVHHEFNLRGERRSKLYIVGP